MRHTEGHVSCLAGHQRERSRVFPKHQSKQDIEEERVCVCSAFVQAWDTNESVLL